MSASQREAIPFQASSVMVESGSELHISNEFLAASYVNKSCDSVGCVRMWPRAIITVGFCCLSMASRILVSFSFN